MLLWVIILLCAVAGYHGNRQNKHDHPKYKVVDAKDGNTILLEDNEESLPYVEDAVCVKVLSFENRPDCVPAEQEVAIQEILSSAVSRQNFAWRLVRHFFTDYELKDHNCFGRRGKLPLNSAKLEKVEQIVFAYYPVDNMSHYPQMWRECVIAIDKGIRNAFSDYGYTKIDDRRMLGKFPL